MSEIHFVWDLEDDPEGNYQHIVIDNGITLEEFEEVFRSNQSNTTTSRSSGRPITFGETATGKYIAIVWEHVMDDPWTVYPITAYETNRPGE
ncbi:hypothetical protein AYO40_06450 [Planctomycetaceae bacterium SCGC AG-212-D15]|nr:hypothetical protein AYO40_06450 [Planctomycetaceae bacterium SCGC AG-212-D15]